MAAAAACLAVLPAPAALGLDVTLGPDGFVTTWWVSGAGSTMAQPGPTFDVKKALGRRAPRKGGTTTLSVRLVASRRGTLRVRAGCSPMCEVRLGDRPVLSVDKPYGLFVDDAEHDVPVAAGEHSLEVRVAWEAKRRTSPQEIALRVLDEQNRVPDWVRVRLQPGSEAPALLAQALPVVWEKSVVPGGVRVKAIVGPSALFPAPVAVRLEGSSPVATHGERVVVETVRSRGGRARLEMSGVSGVLRAESTAVRCDASFLRAILVGREALRAAPAGERFADARDTLAWSIEHLERLVVEGDPDTRFLASRARVVERHADALRRGRDPLEPESGPVLRAYRSELDGRLQVYALYVPPSWRPGKKLPLAVVLHPSGYHPQLILRVALGYPHKGSNRQGARHLPESIEDPGSFVVAPSGYVGTGSRYFGKVDVFTVIEKVARRYGVDRSLVSLSGGSLGGLGSWHIGLRVPDKFNVIAPMAGYGSVRHYPTVRGKPRLDFEQYLVDRRDNYMFVENAQNQPMLCIHGERDDPKRSLVLVDRYRKLGYPHVYEELRDTGHNAWDEGYEGGRVFRFSRAHRRPDRPSRVDFTSGAYRHREAYWVRIEQYQDHDRLARVRGRLGRGRVDVETQNVRRLTLLLSTEPVVPRLDGQPLAPASGEQTFVRGDGGRWQVASAPIPPGEKRPGLSGPMDDIRYEPHVFVYGTADPAQTETNRRLAEHDARYFWNDAEIHMPVVADTDLAPADLAAKHLVLYGNPASNRVLGRMRGKLPARWEPGAIVFGGRRFEGRSTGISFIYPNPLAEGRYVVVHAGVTHRGTWLSSWLPRWVPDYVVYDEGVTAQLGGRLMDTRKVLAGGYFDREWRVPAGAAPASR